MILMIVREFKINDRITELLSWMDIQGISGHSDVFTLMNRYAHPQEEKKIELSEEMTKILTQKLDSPKPL